MQEKEEFSENIIQDVAALGITYEKLTHTSDYFPELLDLAERLIKKGYIYADDTPLEQMREVDVASTFGSLMTCDGHVHKVNARVLFGWKATFSCKATIKVEWKVSDQIKARLWCCYLLLDSCKHF